MVVYRCQATSVGGFVQQLAVAYLGHGYWFYVTGQIPEGKDPRLVDQKLVALYGIDISKWSRARRKRAGVANVQHLRHGRFFVLLATHGTHRFFGDEARSIRDARRTPIRFRGYSVSFRAGHPHVRICQEVYKRIKSHFVEIALHRSAENLAEELGRIRFEPYAPVRRQLLNILRAVNRCRKRASFQPVPSTCLFLKRRIYKPFGSVDVPNRADDET